MSASNPPAALVFIDTNVWLYAFSASQDQQKHVAAQALIRQTPRIVVSTQIVNEVSVNLIRKFQADEQTVQKLIRSFYRKYTVIALNQHVLLHASDLRIMYQFSFWDSLVLASALTAGATIVYSEDMQDGLTVQNQLRISNPFSALTNP
jgi:predicted nucleic acid-binding protein